MKEHLVGQRLRSHMLTRRSLLKAGGLATVAAATARLLPLRQGGLVGGATGAAVQKDIHLAATDGWIFLPGTAIENGITYGPDPAARSPQTTYAFGFRDVTGMTGQQVLNQKFRTQASAPLLWADEMDELRITLTNLGLAQRPDLTDSHSIHFHGFRNAIPLYDGVPEMSIAVPIGRDFTYFYRPRDPGSYMYHCHFEDVEHVSMGMTGIVFVRPAQNKTGAGGGPVARVNGGPTSAPMGYVYNDGVSPSDPNSTSYDREFGMFLSEVWAQERFRDAHIQENDWSDYHPDYWLLNGRTYPGTLAPNGGATDANGDLVPVVGSEELQYQPISSLVQANSGDRVLLRFVNLGYQQHAMTLEGIPMRVVGKDATLLRGRDGTFTSYVTDTVYVGPGESVDAIFVAPPKSGAGYDTYLLYNRKLAYLHNAGSSSLGGQATEVRIFNSGLPAQTVPQT
jgi:FtsP/CotA-like multicopper oxidase with cupredoxin domain